LFGHHGNPFVQPIIIDSAKVFLEDCVKQENCALSVTGAISKLSASGNLIAMATNLITSASKIPTDAFALVPYCFNRKWLLVDSIGGEECSDANHCVKLAVHTDLASLQFDPGRYLSGGFVFDPGVYLQFNPHGFFQSTSTFPGDSLMFVTSRFVPSARGALSSGETNGNQHPLFLHCPAVHSPSFGDGAIETTRCSEFFKAPHLIYHVLFYLVHGGKVYFDGSQVIARSATMARQIKGEMDTLLSGVFDMQMDSSEAA